jgi:hypothetical protein
LCHEEAVQKGMEEMLSWTVKVTGKTIVGT